MLAGDSRRRWTRNDVLHDLYLRAHVVVSGNNRKHWGKSVGKTSRPPKLWPDYALVWDTETTLDLEQRLNFGVWRFCKLEDGDYVSLQEGIFYRDGLPANEVQRILSYVQNKFADGIVPKADQEMIVITRAEFVERVFWESVRAGALIVGFNLPFDIS